jgi:hypothetical protein
MTLLYYNNAPILSGQPTPLVRKESSFIRYGERWAAKSNITLKGQITGCTFADLISNQTRLVQNLSKDFQSFEIIENGEVVYTKPYSIIRDIRFSDSSYSYILDYQVNLDCYEENLFSGVFGVLDPNDEWSFEETNDGLVNVTHSISARGFNTSSGISNALNNAKDFVLNRTGLSNIVTPYFTYTGVSFNPCLKSLSEKIDRFNGNYSVTETYVADKYFGLDGVLRYTVNFECNQEGLTRVSVQGNVDGCGMYSDISGIRTRYSLFDKYEAANEVYENTTNSGTLNPLYITSGITEDIYLKRLTFNISFDNSTGDSTYLDYGVNIQSGENGIITVGFDGQIKGRGNAKERWQNVQGFYSGLNPYEYAVQAYNDFSGAYELNLEPISSGVTYNKFNSQIDVSATWNDSDTPDGFTDFNYTLNYTPSLQKVSSTPLIDACNKEYYVVDLGFASRASFSIDGNGNIDCSNKPSLAVASVKQLANQYFGSECPKIRAVLEENNISTGINSISFRFGWSAESPNKLSNNYSSVENLKLV